MQVPADMDSTPYSAPQNPGFCTAEERQIYLAYDETAR